MSPDRRTLLASMPAALLVSTPLASATPDADAELIRRCHQFAETELRSWYRYVILPDDEGDWDSDFAEVEWITGTPATTPAGWQAKALVYSAWWRDAYDDYVEDRDSCTKLLAAVLRDMVAPIRNAIVARIAAELGPLPDSYTPEGIWIGGSVT